MAGDMGTRHPDMDFGGMRRLVDAVHDEHEIDDESSEDDASSMPSISGYQLERFIGSGAGGEVYSAFREGSDRRVAVKLLRGRLGDDRQIKRSRRELQVLEDLRIAAAPRLVDHGVHEGRRFLVTEYIDGHSLTEHCERNKLRLRERVALVARAADALQSVHEQGVIHRDLKPTNILVTKRGLPVIIDLGVATMEERSSLETLTEEGVSVGSPAFMPPEQARGERRLISTRSDVYGLGATAYAALLGVPPHGDEETRRGGFRATAFEPAIDPCIVDRTFPKDLAAVLLKALSLAPEARYASASEFATDLRRWLAGDPVEAKRPSAWVRTTKWMQRKPLAVAAVLGLLIGGTVALTVIVYNQWMNAQPVAVDISDDLSKVFLRARSGRELHRWNAGASSTPGHFKFADLISSGDGGSQKDVVVIAFPQEAPYEYAGSMCGFESPNFSNPLWVDKVRFPPALYYAARDDNVSDTFRVTGAFMADFFPQFAGDELLLWYSHRPWSASCLRILHPSTGDLLFERWHNGNIRSISWLQDTSTLLVGASYSDLRWAELGFEIPDPQRSPIVAFAVQPRVGDVDKIVRANGSTAENAIWYRCLLPPEEVIGLGLGAVRFLGARGDVFPDEYAEASVERSRSSGEVHFLVSHKGEFVFDFAADEYGEEPLNAWDLTRLYWGDAPTPPDDLPDPLAP